MTNLGMFLHGLLDHDPGVEDLLQHLWETIPLSYDKPWHVSSWAA
jgi:hypothetical protein